MIPRRNACSSNGALTSHSLLKKQQQERRNMASDDHFGVCPVCGKHDGYVNVGRSHWFVCNEHKVKWCFGANVFSSWREQSEEEQRRIYDARGIGSYRDVSGYKYAAGQAALQAKATADELANEAHRRGASATEIENEWLRRFEDELCQKGFALVYMGTDEERQQTKRNIELAIVASAVSGHRPRGGLDDEIPF
jgi:hypothetical protein